MYFIDLYGEKTLGPRLPNTLGLEVVGGTNNIPKRTP